MRVAREKEGTPWAITVTAGPRQKPRVMAADAAAPFGKMDTIHFLGRVVRKKGKLRIGFAITDGKRHGLSILKDGRRVPVGYEVLDGKGAVLAKGVLRYG